MQADQLYLNGTGMGGWSPLFGDEYEYFKETNDFFNDDFNEITVERNNLLPNSFENFLNLNSYYLVGGDEFNREEHAYSAISKRPCIESQFSRESCFVDDGQLSATDNRVPESRMRINYTELCEEQIGVSDNEYIDGVDICAEKMSIGINERLDAVGVKDEVAHSDFKEIFEVKSFDELLSKEEDVMATCLKYVEGVDIFGPINNESKSFDLLSLQDVEAGCFEQAEGRDIFGRNDNENESFQFLMEDFTAGCFNNIDGHDIFKRNSNENKSFQFSIDDVIASCVKQVEGQEIFDHNKNENKSFKLFSMGENVNAGCFKKDEFQDFFGPINKNLLAVESSGDGDLNDFNYLLTDQEASGWMDQYSNIVHFLSDLDPCLTDEENEIDIIHDDEGDVCSESSQSIGHVGKVTRSAKGNRRDGPKNLIGRKRKRNYKNIASEDEDDADWSQNFKAPTRKSSFPNKENLARFICADSDGKDERKREQNKVAATRYRRKKKQEEVNQTDLIRLLSLRNEELRRNIAKIEMQVEKIKKVICV